MTRILVEPPNLGSEFWERPKIVAAVRAGRLDVFLTAYRGADEVWCSQDNVARWVGRRQPTISFWEHGKTPATERQLHHAVDAVLLGLQVPRWLATSWGETAESMSRNPQGVTMGGGQ